MPNLMADKYETDGRNNVSRGIFQKRTLIEMALKRNISSQVIYEYIRNISALV
jgi:hypothetical protein